ncbi:unnamed protein product [Owenia fusiformis]|uniref:Uncharacterized protein n=1 Tax=Owenia fusiformis TaxID=6347 RepID=A0A8S4P983_OWEFU|nr:unnamed protein product [Owenia fusiformis]
MTTNNEQQEGEQNDRDEYDNRTFRYKLVKNIFLFLSRVFMGMYLEISGPTLLDLRDRVGVNYEEISRVLVAKSVGYFISSVFGGFLVDKLKGHVDLLISLGCFMGAVGTAIIPWSPSMPFMGVMFHLQGLGEGIIDVGGDNLVIRMWGDKAAAPIHSLYFAFVGGERTLSKFLFAFATDGPLKFTKDNATILNTVFWASFTAGRGLAMLAAKFVGPRILLIVELIMNLIVAIVLLTLGYRFAIVMWIFTALQGACLAPLFPSGIAWLNIYLKVTGMALAVFYIGASFGGMAFQWVTGYLFQNYGPMSWLYIILVYAIAVNIIFWAMQVIAWKFGTVIIRKNSLKEIAANDKLNYPLSNPRKDADLGDDDDGWKEAIIQTDHCRL